MDIKEALTFEGLKYFYTTYIKPIRTRVSQLGSAANCTVVNNSATTTANTVLDGRMGKKLHDYTSDVHKSIMGSITLVGKEIGTTDYIGEYGSQWSLATDYKDIGNSRTFDNSFFQATANSSRIHIKKDGNYLIIAKAEVNSSAYNNIWMKTLYNGEHIDTSVTVANGTTTIQTCFAKHCEANSYLETLLAKTSEESNVTTDGRAYLQVVRLTSIPGFVM